MKALDDVFRENGVIFEGTGPKVFNPQTGMLEERKDADINDDDPYGFLGYGWEAYFSSLQIFMWVFFLMSVLMIPAYYYYISYAGLRNVTLGYYNSVFMLGNMGFNKAVCL